MAGSLEATFLDLADIEQEQDHYIGAVETPVIDALDADDLASGAMNGVATKDAVQATPHAEFAGSDTKAQRSAPVTPASSPWDEWLRAHGVTASQRPRRRSSPTQLKRSSAGGAQYLSAGNLWSALNTQEGRVSGEEHPPSPQAHHPSGDPLPPGEAPNDTHTLWEQME